MIGTFGRRKNIWANFQRIIELFTKKIVKKLLKIWSWDPGSRIPDPGVKKHPIPDPDPGFDDLKLKKITAEKKINFFFGSKTTICRLIA